MLKWLFINMQTFICRSPSTVDGFARCRMGEFPQIVEEYEEYFNTLFKSISNDNVILVCEDTVYIVGTVI